LANNIKDKNKINVNFFNPTSLLFYKFDFCSLFKFNQAGSPSPSPSPSPTPSPLGTGKGTGKK